jgi:hypothetical protein
MRHAGDLQEATAVLEAHGVDLVVIDGAYGRTVAARSELSDAIIVSTGAVLSDDVEEVCSSTVALVDRLALEVVEPGWQSDLLEAAIAADRCLLGGPSIAPIELASPSALLGLKGAGALFGDQVAGVAVPGLVSDSVIEELFAVPGRDSQAGRTLLVPDGTVLQASAGLLRRLERSWRIRAASSARVVAISINPSGVQGNQIDAESLRNLLLEALGERWPKLSVFNPLHSKAAPA